MDKAIIERAAEITAAMPDAEKAKMLSGADFWRLYSSEKYGLAEIAVSDGPHGLRQQPEKVVQLGAKGSVPSTCFPPAATTACSFDPELLRQVGEAIGEEARRQDVAVVLGPAVNHKRSPLCGRNFEYVSEDPCLTGELATAIIDGIQSKGVGTSIKHFCCNSQERARFLSDSIVDERALREIYLRGFEKAICEAKPWTIMTAYNQLNGLHCAANKRLLTDIARGEWGFDGLFETDWGAITADVGGCYEAGLDLEMPGTGSGTDKIILKALESGRLSRERFEAAAQAVAALILRAVEGEKTEYSCDMDAHLRLAQHAAEQSAVLLKNDGILPYSGGSVAVIGSMAKRPRYQGAGSSHINPAALDNACEAFEQAGIKFDYADGYGDEETKPNKKRIAQAVKAAKGKDIVFVFAGLPASVESEGYDRDDITMPESHNRLIEAVAAVNPNVVVVLSCGSAIAMPWLDKVKGVLLMYLGGCQLGKAAVSLLIGKVNPSGKLSETFPLALADTPCHGHFAENRVFSDYRESIFTGYRYYDTVGKRVQFPFGFGLSYTDFSYDEISIDGGTLAADGNLRVSVKVTNTGKREGKETVLLFVGKKESALYRPKKELKGFKKLTLAAGESGTAEFELTADALSVWNTKTDGWYAEPGEYQVYAAASVEDVRLTGAFTLEGEEQPVEDLRQTAPCYYNVSGGSLEVSDDEYRALIGRELPVIDENAPVTLNSPISDMMRSFVGRRILAVEKRKVIKSADPEENIDKMIAASLYDMPMRAATMSGMTWGEVEAMVLIAQGKTFKGLRQMRKSRKK